MGIQADGRFVEDDDPRFGEQGVRDADALTKAFRELPDESAGGAAGEVAVIHDLADALADARGVDILEAGPECKVLFDAHVFR